MRHLYLNQKILAVRDKFAVLDDQEQPVYQVAGSLFRIPKQFEITDTSGRVVGTVTKKVVALMPRFDLNIDRRTVVTIQKKVTFFKPRYELIAAGLTVQGDFWDMNFEVVRDGVVVGSVAKRWFSIGDKYEISIANDDDELIMVGLVVAIDYVKRLEAAGRRSSSSE
ncbi:LURP-one-related/scramblase family protein [Lactiplantibacillus fabifermentans]|uniref:LURP-one-related family protein n=2 Tax=Lactiplantibacillus fabifermentans TaxID=483011 RepID=A0A0R2NLB3_9LACO|nr:LURP-one-related family protein [Lactiplantibacillus fabifermentans]ETY73373.1 hypothetical protein LFAB_12785 [Lactiplantibacillus fabifermentans T30PCM01]KRO26561.1 hypothetical protein DY78_GL000825 [Lactiplantibacillus fabifermentans DSM 21115]